MIKEVIFDIDDTLYDYEKGHAAGVRQMQEYAEQELGVSGEEFEREYRRQHADIKKRLGTDDATIHSRSIRIQNMLEHWGKPLFPHVTKLYHAYWDTLHAVSEPEPGSIEAVRSLREMGIRVGIGSDMTFRMQYEKLGKFGFGPYISHMVTSQEAGHEKPHPDFMALCIEKAGCRPDEIVFMGDNFRKDVEGSVLAGMHGVWYRAKEKPLPEDVKIGPESYQIIRHYDELIPYIKSIR